jgi:hypothetical protein
MRLDTIGSFRPFVFWYGGREVTVRQRHIVSYAIDAAADLGVSCVKLSKAWRAFSLVHYGELRRWPGPERVVHAHRMAQLERQAMRPPPVP